MFVCVFMVILSKSIVVIGFLKSFGILRVGWRIFFCLSMLWCFWLLSGVKILCRCVGSSLSEFGVDGFSALIDFGLGVRVGVFFLLFVAHGRSYHELVLSYCFFV